MTFNNERQMLLWDCSELELEGELDRAPVRRFGTVGMGYEFSPKFVIASGETVWIWFVA